VSAEQLHVGIRHGRAGRIENHTFDSSAGCRARVSAGKRIAES
jgi:hypothetical protein